MNTRITQYLVLALLLVGAASCKKQSSESEKTNVAPAPTAAAANELCPDEDACKKACDENNLQACETLSDWYFSSGEEGSPEEAARAFTYAKRACDGGRQTACALVASAYVEGKGVAADPNLGVELGKKACDASVADACGLLSSVYEERGEKELARKYDELHLAAMVKVCDARGKEAPGNECYAVKDVLKSRGDIEGAKKVYRQALAIAKEHCLAGHGQSCWDRARSQDPDEQDWRERIDAFAKLCELIKSGKETEMSRYLEHCGKSDAETQSYLAQFNFNFDL